MVAANPQRTSWTPEEVRGNLSVQWYRPIEPYIPYKIQPIAANGKIYVPTSRGLYAFSAINGDLLWVYPTELPLGNSPTIAKVNGRSTAYVGGYDRKIHAIDANSGQEIQGYTAFEAGAGFETNPLVINNAIFAGNRDGYFYALDAISGNLIWKYKTDGPILFSAAYKDGEIYFASNDSFAYALRTDGTLVWKSQKLLGAGFQTYWPVVYTEKTTGKDYLVFTKGENYRMVDNANEIDYDEEYFYPGCHLFPGYTCPPGGTLIGASGTDSGSNTYWGHSAKTIDVSAINGYYESNPSRRTVFILDQSTGKEYTFDSNGNGKAEYAPITWAGGVTNSGNKYPPVINGNDGVYYQDIIYCSGGGWIACGQTVGWKFGSHVVSQVADYARAVDEPMSFSSGGNLIYYSLCCDRAGGSFDVTIPSGQTNRSWTLWNYSLNNIAPGYDQMYFDGDIDLYNDINGWQVYSGKNQSKNGVYAKHGTSQSPPIPYQGKVFVLKGNSLIAFGPSGGGKKLPLATIVPVQNGPSRLTTAELQQRLGVEIQKMLDAGPLRPGYFSAGFIDLYSGKYTDSKDYGEIFDYFQNPADTVVTLLQALPYLSSSVQSQVKTYLQNNYGPSGTYSFTNIVHVGWNVGAAREVFEIPPDIWTSKFANFGPRTSPICGNCGYWHSFPPYSFYAAWKYALVFGNAKSIFDQMSSKLEAPLSDSYFIERPYMLNLYIAGYQGYLELQKMAGYSESSSVKNNYNHMLSLRTTNFLSIFKDPPTKNYYYPPFENYFRALSVSRNFMFLTPELADYMNKNIPPHDMQAVMDEYTYVAPYWFVTKFDDSYGEGSLQHLYDSPALFQAKAYIQKLPYNELVKWLDVPAFYRGDLFYIQNLVAALSAN
jgi:hypothetical protein